MRCPYDDCTFEGTEQEVDDHVAYLGMMGDKDHEPDKRREGA